MILRNNNIWHLSIAILVFLIFTGCSKQETIRPSIESYFVKLDTTLQLKPDKSVIQLDSILKYTDDLSDLERAMLLFNKGEAEYLNLKYENSFNTQLKSYELFTSLNDKYNEGRCLITLSGSSLHMGDLEASQVYALKALSLSQLIGNKRIEGKAYNQLFKLHYELKDYEKALSYIEKTDSLYSQQADTLSIIAIKNNKASIYVEQKEYNKALTTYSEAMTLSQSKRDPKILVSVLNNIGYTYIEAGKYDDAERFLRGAATLNKNINSVNAAPYKGLGNLFLLTSKIDSSWTNYNKALEIYKSNNDINEEIKVRDKLVAVSLFYGDYAKALNNQIIRDSLQLNLSQIEQENLLEFANVKYEVKQKETEINHQREINSRNRLLTISMVLLFVSLAVVTGVFVYNSRLRAANKSSKLEQSLLRVQMNPHFIFNTLAAIQNITLEGDAIKSSNYIAKFSKLIRQNFDYVRKESITLE
ncbi:MAG: tetratricopeptide repeat protein, partial [Nonlabens sp.]